jgi:DNA-binding XRE family transcriptional regulator
MWKRIEKKEVDVVKNIKDHNYVREIRKRLFLTKAKLARKAGISPLTIVRVEKGKSCRIETKRKIILALGYKVTDKDKVFPNG